MSVHSHESDSVHSSESNFPCQSSRCTVIDNHYPPPPPPHHPHATNHIPVPHKCVGEIWAIMGSEQATSHYMNQSWLNVNWALRNKLRWNFNRNTKLSAKWRQFCPGRNELNGPAKRRQERFVFCRLIHTGYSNSDMFPPTGLISVLAIGKMRHVILMPIMLMINWVGFDWLGPAQGHTSN